MSLRPFLYYLTLEDGRCLTVVNGVVSQTGSRKPLVNTPDGWQEKLIAWERNQARHGIIRNYTAPLGFVRDGAQILKDILYKNNIEQKIFLVIQQLGLEYTVSHYKWLYEYLYKGELDLSTLKHDQDKVTVSIMEGGLSKLLKANENTTYDINLTDDGWIFVKMDGIKRLFTRTAFAPVNQTLINAIRYNLGVYEISREGTAPDVIWLDVQRSPLGSFPNDGYMVSVEREQVIRFRGSLSWEFLKNTTLECKLEVNDGSGSGSTSTTLFSSTGTEGNSGTAEFDETITVPAGHRVHFTAESNGAGLAVEHIAITASEIIAEYEYQYVETYVKARHPLDLFQALVEKITGARTNGESDLLDTKSNLPVTSGDAIRGIETAVIKTSFNQFFEAFNAVLNVGVGIESGVIRMEEKAHFYDDSDPIDLGEVKNLEVSYAADLVHNALKIGYTEPRVEDVNGKSSFNGTHQYTSPITRIAKELSLVSGYKADPYEIETKRINLDGRTTTDHQGDNDVHILNIDLTTGVTSVGAALEFHESGDDITAPTSIRFVPGQKIEITGSVSNDGIYTVLSVTDNGANQSVFVDGALTDEQATVTIDFISGAVYDLKRETYDTLEGIPEVSADTIFNIEELTPKRLLLKHANWLHSIMDGFDTEKLKFQSTQRNDEVKTVLGAVTVDENADVSISSLGTKLFKPFYFDFETEVPINLVDLLEASTNRCFQFTWDGNTYKGFLIKAGLAPHTLEQQQFKLLSTIDNELTQLI